MPHNSTMRYKGGPAGECGVKVEKPSTGVRKGRGELRAQHQASAPRKGKELLVVLGLKPKPGWESGPEEHTCVHTRLLAWEPNGMDACVRNLAQPPGRELWEEEEQTGTGMHLPAETTNTVTCKPSNTAPLEMRRLLVMKNKL